MEGVPGGRQRMPRCGASGQVVSHEPAADAPVARWQAQNAPVAGGVHVPKQRELTAVLLQAGSFQVPRPGPSWGSEFDGVEQTRLHCEGMGADHTPLVQVAVGGVDL